MTPAPIRTVAGDHPETSPGPHVPADRGSLAMAMLFLVVALGLTALLVPVMLVQNQQTRHVAQRVNALLAAQAGLDRALAQIRAGVGDVATLPCTVHSAVDPAATAQYDLTVRYLSWAGQELACPPSDVPATAELTSTGTVRVGSAPPSSRTLTASYRFRTSNENILGGRIHVMPAANSVDRCMDAGSRSPVAGTVLRMQDCVEGRQSQIFGYTRNLNLVLMASRTAAQPNGMCLEAPPEEAAFVTFQPCAPTTKYAQQWSFNDMSNFEGTSDGTNLNGFCMNSQTPSTVGTAAGSPVLLRSGASCNRSDDSMQTFAPESSVGAGAAGAQSGQLVNYAQFGRCVDVTEFDPSLGYLIVFPCKQSPDPNVGLSWNQKWTLPAAGGAGPITTRSDRDGKLYCLRSPGAPYDPVTKGPYVAAVDCASTSTGVTWSVSGDTGSYATSYRIRNSDGLCLAAIDQSVADYWRTGERITKIAAASCTDSLLQKWNAPADLVDGIGLKDYAER